MVLSYDRLTINFRLVVFTYTSGSSLAALLFFLMLVRACCFILADSPAWCVLRTELHIGTKIHKLHNFFEW